MALEYQDIDLGEVSQAGTKVYMDGVEQTQWEADKLGLYQHSIVLEANNTAAGTKGHWKIQIKVWSPRATPYTYAELAEMFLNLIGGNESPPYTLDVCGYIVVKDAYQVDIDVKEGTVEDYPAQTVPVDDVYLDEGVIEVASYNLVNGVAVFHTAEPSEIYFHDTVSLTRINF